MNLQLDLSKKNQELLKDLDISVENKDYTSEELRMCTGKIADHIFSQSSKNYAISREAEKYNDLMNILFNNI